MYFSPRKLQILSVVCLFILLFSTSALLAQDETATPEEPPTPTLEVPPTETVIPSETAAPTETTIPTETQAPTETVIPSETPLPPTALPPTPIPPDGEEPPPPGSTFFTLEKVINALIIGLVFLFISFPLTVIVGVLVFVLKILPRYTRPVAVDLTGRTLDQFGNLVRGTPGTTDDELWEWLEPKLRDAIDRAAELAMQRATAQMQAQIDDTQQGRGVSASSYPRNPST